MKRSCLPDGARINTVVEEFDKRTSPAPADGKRVAPTLGAFHRVGRKIE